MPPADGESVGLLPHTRRNHRREREQGTSIKVAERMAVGDSLQPEHHAHYLPIGIAQDHRSSAKVDIGSSYEYRDEKLTESLERGQTVPSTITRVEKVDSRNITPAEAPSSFIATFDAKTMTEVTTKSTKKMPKGKAKAIRANRNKTCEKHRKQKKQCDPETCPGNKRWRERQVTGWELSEESELAERARASRELAAKRAFEKERIQKETARRYPLERVGYGDDVEAIERFDYSAGGDVDVDNSSFYSKFQSAEATEQAKPLSFLLKEDIDHAETDTKGKEPATSQRKPEPDRRPFQESFLRIAAAEEGKQIWNRSGRASQEIPRFVWGGPDSDAPCELGKIYSTGSNYSLANSPLALFDSHINGDKAAGGLDEGNNGGGGELDENKGHGGSDSNEYGDWFQGYDAHWGDGAGPSGSGQPEGGGGYRKPGGGYYALASELEVKMANMSIK